MKGIMKRLFVFVMLLTLCAVPFGVANAASDPLSELEKQIKAGRTSDIAEYDDLYLCYSSNENGVLKTYDKSGGGYYLYKEIMDDSAATTGYINETKFNELTAGGRREFLTDVIRIGNNLVSHWSEEGQNSQDGSRYISEQTMNTYMEKVQNLPNAGSQLISSLMAQTKPDYVTANRIYQPFSGVVGTILGVISILIMSLLGVTMANDLAYIVIPMYQLFLDGDSDGDSKGTKGMAKIVSQEARNAVKSAENDGGAGGQSGTKNKLAVGVYFKHRWKSLVILGICLLYLVQGQIYSFVGWILDLLSGFIGF